MAVLADIHGNIWALSAVLDDLRQKGIQKVINLGDSLYGPLAPQATWERIRSFPMISIMGNQDRLICHGAGKKIRENRTLAFVMEDLTEEAILWLKALPGTYRQSSDLFCCHGTPDDDTAYLLEDVDRTVACLRDEKAIVEDLAGERARLILCGHTHIPRVVTLADGRLVVNPGSVGLPGYTDTSPVFHRMETASPHAAYALVTPGASGFRVEMVQVPYDWEKAARAAKAKGREDWAFSLRTGRTL